MFISLFHMPALPPSGFVHTLLHFSRSPCLRSLFFRRHAFPGSPPSRRSDFASHHFLFHLGAVSSCEAPFTLLRSPHLLGGSLLLTSREESRILQRVCRMYSVDRACAPTTPRRWLPMCCIICLTTGPWFALLFFAPVLWAVNSFIFLFYPRKPPATRHLSYFKNR